MKRSIYAPMHSNKKKDKTNENTHTPHNHTPDALPTFGEIPELLMFTLRAGY
jgi:hypothetical protein